MIGSHIILNAWILHTFNIFSVIALFFFFFFFREDCSLYFFISYPRIGALRWKVGHKSLWSLVVGGQETLWLDEQDCFYMKEKQEVPAELPGNTLWALQCGAVTLELIAVTKAALLPWLLRGIKMSCLCLFYLCRAVFGL